MKLKSFVYFLAISMSFILSSCAEKESESTSKGKVEFSSIIQNSLKSYNGSDSTEILKVALVEIKNSNQEIVVSNQKLQLYKFGENYVSEPVDLIAGSYTLTKFLLINEFDEVVYAAPVEGSEKAYLVNDPLPISIMVEKDAVSKVSPEVIKAIGQMPEDFGYTIFGFNIVETYDFLIAAFIYNDTINNFSLTKAHLEVTSNLDTLYSGEIKPLTNQITVNVGYSNYKIRVTKPGYSVYQKEIPEDSITKYFSEPIMVILQNQNLSNGLVAYYPFNGNTNDQSGNDHDGVNNGATLTNDRFGNMNSAYNFDGDDDFMEISPIPVMSEVDNFTVSLWYYFNEFNIQELADGLIDRQYVFCGHSHSDTVQSDYFRDGFLIYIDLSADNKPSLNNTTFKLNGNNYSFKNLLINNFYQTWHHVVFVRKDNQTFHYVDGVLVDSIYNDGVILNMNHNLYLGTFSGDNPYYQRLHYNFDGKIDDIRIYNIALKEEEVTALYNE